MFINSLGITVNDLQPYYYVQLKDSSGVAIDLAGASIVCTMRNVDGSAAKILRQSTGITITDVGAGEFQYEWQGAETDTPGLYNIEFEVSPATGGKFTFPNPEIQGRAQVRIRAGLDAI
ncbi:MAG: hypothetical protein KAR06_01640 [Deltaproteobacteria bacterium]|nr:hypothetical protein [Deltaproteobacteria bacterium]